MVIEDNTKTYDDTISSARLNNIKDIIEGFEKEQQIQILRIFKVRNININENKNGVFINLTNLDPKSIEELELFINHLKTQDKILSTNENVKTTYIETFFKDIKNNKVDKGILWITIIMTKYVVVFIEDLNWWMDLFQVVLDFYSEAVMAVRGINIYVANKRYD